MSRLYHRLAFKKYPWIISFDLSNQIDDELNDKLLEQCIKSDDEHRHTLPEDTYNTKLDNTDEMKILYNLFVKVCHIFFTNIPEECLLEKQSRRSQSAYVSYGKRRYDSYWHNHCNRATINSVYYVSVPDKGGTLSVMLDNAEDREIKVKEKEMIFMPGWLTHKPNPCEDEYPRASVNMEFLSDTRAVLKPDNFDMKEYKLFGKGGFVLW